MIIAPGLAVAKEGGAEMEVGEVAIQGMKCAGCKVLAALKNIMRCRTLSMGVERGLNKAWALRSAVGKLNALKKMFEKYGMSDLVKLFIE